MDVITDGRFLVLIYFFINTLYTELFCLLLSWTLSMTSDGCSMNLPLFQLTGIHAYGECFHKPSFVSSYSPLKANAGPQSEAVTEHGFSEIPIKVEVQVKSARSSPGAQVVFPGIGSSQRDDDFNSPYGGVVYRYDKNSVYMYVPNRNDGYPAGTVIYTGGNTWVGSIAYNETQANVRVRAWKTSDFPKPDFESNWTIIRAQNETDSYLEVPHGLGMEPEYVVVQVRHGETDMVSEGIGSSMHLSTVNHQTEWGGLIYSYDDHLVRLWAPGFYGVGYVFSAADGWGYNANITVNYGYVKIRAWKFFNGKMTISDRLQFGNNSKDVKDYSFGRRVSLDNILLSLTMKSPTSNFVFPAMGAVQNSKSRESYGGVVYSYSEIALHLWHPPVNGRFDRGYIVYVDNYWGSSVESERSKSAQLQIRAWNAYDNTCPPLATLQPALTKKQSITTPQFIQSTSMKLLTTRTTTTSTTTAVIASTFTITSLIPSTIPTTPLNSKMVTSMKTTNTSSASATASTSVYPTVSMSTMSTVKSTSVVQSTSSQSNASSDIPSSLLSPVTAGAERDSGGISSAAIAAIAAVTSLVGIACLSGLLFAFIKRMKERKRKAQVEPEKHEMETTEENSAV